MKKILLFILIPIMCMPIIAANEEFLIESITPASTSVFVKTLPIRNLLRSVNGFINHTFTASQKKDLLKSVEEFKTKTGIDLLNEANLRRAGVDITKPMAYAIANAGKPEEKILIFIPVLDPKTAPLKISQVLSVLSDDEIEPVISKHKDVEILKVKDAFYFAAAAYCVIASNESFVKQVIDLASGEGAALNADPMYQKYLLNINKRNEINGYIKPDFQGIQKMLDSNFGKDKSAIEYLSFGLTLNPQRIAISFGAEYSGGTSEIASLIDVLKSGNTAVSLYNNRTLIYGLLSLDPEKLQPFLTAKLANPRDNLSREAAKLNRITGVNIADEFVPNMGGAISVYMENPLTGDYVVFMPMKDAAKTKAFMTKFEEVMKARFEAEKRFAATTINKVPGFWVRDPKGKRTFYCSNARGIFIGTSTELITRVMGFQPISEIKTKDATLNKIDENLFMIARIRRNDLLGQFIMGQLSRQGLISAGDMAELSKTASRIGDIFLTGSKKKNYIEIQLDVSLSQTPARKQ